MNHFIKAVEDALEAENLYAALALTLVLPDICGKLLEPGERTKKRYTKWFDIYIAPTYTSTVGANRTEKVFLTGADCYALRCAFLHAASDDITDQPTRQVDGFQFVVPSGGIRLHRNILNNRLQLEVDWFCQDILSGVSQFQTDVAGDSAIAQRMTTLLKIYDINGRAVG